MCPAFVLLRVLAVAVVLSAAAGTAPAVAELPRDQRFSEEWALQPGAALDGPAAWALGGTGAGTVVAVLDTGIDAGHPDLRGALWTNPGEIAGNGVDDDRDGTVDDVNGVDLVRGDGTPEDENGHGTHVAGIIAAAHDDVGVAGLAPGARIMAVKVLDAARSGTTGDVAVGIRYALAHGADVINVSVNGDTADRRLTDALAAADAAGVPVVASAGNDGRNLDLFPSYPASSDLPTVLAVAGDTREGLLAAFSNFGLNSVDIAAPGVDVLSTAPGGGYDFRSGTSMAAPWVTATLALLHGARADLSGAQLVATLRATARRPSGLLGLLQTGQLDPVAALRAVVSADRIAAADAAAAQPSLTARVARRASRKGHARRLLVTWRLAGRSSEITTFEVTGRGGRTLASRTSAARGAWVSTNAPRVRVTALDDGARPVASVVVRLR